MILQTIFLIILHQILLIQSEDTENLKKLINSNIENAIKYELPKTNNEIFESILESPFEDFGNYDFIVIGAGSSGSVIASRLSEIENWKVLLLEAGGEEDDFTDIPDMMFWSLFSERNWGYYSTPQETCCQGMMEKRCFYPRGKLLGGTSSVNALMYARGNPKDFDHWQELGNKGWSYEDVLPYFKKSENYSIPHQDAYHGYGGPMNVRYAEPENQFYSIFSKANEELGIHHTDYNEANQIGYSKVQFNQKDGKRVSSNKAFLHNFHQQNLEISTKTYVTKIILNQKNEAEGVEFIKNNKKFYAKASKEVILSAGAINSPQLLMLSGIGPKEELDKLGIKVIKNLPVGKFLRDHINFFGLNFRINLTEVIYSKDEILQQYLNGKGDLTIAANDRAIGFYKTNGNLNVPDIEYILVPPSTNPFGKPGKRVFNADENFSEYLNKLNQSSVLTMFMIFLHPKSFGSVTLKTKNPWDFPNIDIKYFSDEKNEDLETMYKGIKFILKLTETKAFQKINPKLISGIKNCETFKENSKDFWYCALKTLATSSYHPVSTTRMGTSEDDSVVDSNLKVHGVGKLRVADCGVFPSTTSGHPHAVAVMIGEKISDVIKKVHSSSK